MLSRRRRQSRNEKTPNKKPRPSNSLKRSHTRSISSELNEFNESVERNYKGPAGEGADDDMLIAYLEKKLAVKGSKDKQRSLIKSVVDEEFGGDDELLALIENVHGAPESGLSGSDASSGEEGSSSGHDTASDHYSDSEEETMSSPGDILPAAEKLPLAEGEVKAVGVWRRGMNKSAEATGEPDLLTQCKIAVRGAFNRVGEGNVEITSDALMKSVMEAKDKFQLSKIGSLPNAEVEACVAEFVSEVCEACAQEALNFLYTKVALALTAPQAALLCSVSGRLNHQALIRYLTRVVHKFDSSLKSYLSRSDDQMKDNGMIDVDDKEMARQCVHSVSLIAYYGFLDMDWLVEFCRFIGQVQEDSKRSMEREVRLELLSIVFRICSAELKTNYEVHYHQIEAVINTLIETFSEGSTSMHLEWIKHELSNVGKHRKAPMYEKFLAMKNWLRKYLVAGCVEVLDAESWLESMLRNEVPKFKAATYAKETAVGESAEESRLRALAKKNHIKSPLQQDIFIGMARSKSVADAMTNILKCVTQTKNVEPCLAVILHCALREKSYNPFYTAVIGRLCSMPDMTWRKKFARGLRRGLFLLTAAEATKDLKPDRLWRIVNDLKEALDPKDFANILSRRIFNNQNI